MTLFIALLGLITVIISGYIASEFFLVRRNLDPGVESLAGDLAWQLVGEAVMGLGTLAFALGAHFELLQYWPEWVQSSIRLAMFSVTAITSIRLLLTVRRITFRAIE